MSAHFFNPDIAVEIGLNESIIFSGMLYGIIQKATVNMKDKSEFDAFAKRYRHNGRWWVYNSVDTIKSRNPYLGEKQIRNALKKLEEKHFLKSDTLSSQKYDRTKWYALEVGCLKHLSNIEKTQLADDILTIVDDIEKEGGIVSPCFQTFALSTNGLNKHPAKRANGSDQKGKCSYRTSIELSSSCPAEKNPSHEPKFKTISPDWLPSPDVLAVLARTNGIPNEFALSQVSEFVKYWLDRGTKNLSWDSKFISSVNRNWTHHKANPPAPTRKQPTKLPDDFALTSDREQVCLNLAPELINDVGMIFNHFVSNSIKNDTTLRDWDGAWAEWIIRELKFHKERSENNKTFKDRDRETANRSLMENLNDTSWADKTVGIFQ